MTVTQRFDAQKAKGIIQKNIAKNTTILSDGYKTYKVLEKEFEKLITKKVPSNQAYILFVMLKSFTRHFSSHKTRIPTKLP